MMRNEWKNGRSREIWVCSANEQIGHGIQNKYQEIA